MEIILRVPTADQYAFCEIRFDSDEMTPEQIRKAYDEYISAFKSSQGLPTKEWNDVLDEYRKNKGMDADKHELMDKEQQWMIHELDKSDSRLANKASKLSS